MDQSVQSAPQSAATPGTRHISPEGHAKLLDMTYARLLFSITVLPFVALALSLFYARFHTSYALMAWAAAYIVFAMAARIHRRQYVLDQRKLTAAAMIRKWRPILQNLALAHGFGLSIPAFAVIGRAPFEFVLLYLLTLAAIMAGNATHQTPVLGVYLRFFAVGWNLPVVLLYWIMPGEWPVVIPLCLLYSLGMIRHARIANRFFVQQVVLEQQGAQLAEQYKHAKEQAEAALRAKNQFLATASHDLRQPVHAIGMMIEAIGQRNQDPSLAPLLNDLKSGVRSVNFMFNSLLDLSKIESGAITPKPETVAAQHMMRDIITLFGEEARRRGLSLRLFESKHEVIVNADPVLLRQTIINLVHNALRYTPKGGVLLGARKRGGNWQLEVWDTGVGVAQADQASIHSASYTKTHAWNINDAGHGLGLAVVARCAELMGAQYGVTSRLGQGTRCWLRLPAVQADSAALGNVECVQHVASAGLRNLGGTCLIVEDDPQVGNAWLMLLQAWGIDVRLVPDGASAFTQLDDGFLPRAIFCDQRLRSGESGFDVLRALLDRCPAAHGAMVSGELHSPELAQADAEGYVVLKKPLNVEDLHAVLSRWLMAAPQAAAPATH